MNLVIIISSMEGGGAERVTANLANYWAEDGWNVSIITFSLNTKDFYKISNKINRIKFEFESSYKNETINKLLININRIIFIRSYLRSLNPDVALSMMTGGNILLAIASFGLKIRLIGSERTHPPEYPLGKLLEFFRKYTYRMFDSIVAATNETALWLKSETYGRKIITIPNSVNFPIESFEPILNVNRICRKDRKILIAVGRLSIEKQFSMLIKAFKILSNNYPEWDLVILGEGPLRKILEDEIAGLELNHRIFLPGKVGNVAEWYCRASLFVLCSKFEGFPNSLLEAMTYGVPSISFDCDTGPRDIIENGVNGLLIKSLTKDGLTNGLDQIMSNEIMRDQFSSEALKLREKFSFKKIVKKWESLIY